MQGNASSPLEDKSMRAQYADALASCNKYQPINYQLPNEVISRSITLPHVLAPCAFSPKSKLDGRDPPTGTTIGVQLWAYLVEPTARLQVGPLF
jgi:hypothetical protein